MPSPIQSPGTILRYKTRHDFTRSIEDPDTAPACRDALRARNACIVVEGRCFKVQFFANAARFKEVDAPPEANCSPPTLWQRFIRLIAGDRLRAHLDRSIDKTGAPTFMGPVAKWSPRDAAALRDKVQRHRFILNCPLPEGHDAALYHLKFHTRGIDREVAELLFRQKQFKTEGLNLRRGMLKGIDLSGRQLQRTILNECELSDAKLSGADLSGASLRMARLRRAILGGAQVKDADLCGADLREADLRGLDLASAKLEGAKLRGARLEGATLALAQLLTLIKQGVDVRGAKVRWTRKRRRPDDGRHLRTLIRAGVDLRGADLRGLYLPDFKFKGANLQGAKLQGAFLDGADLTSNQLSGADLRKANLERVRLGRCTLAGARLSRASLTSLKRRPLTQGILGREEHEASELKNLLYLVPPGASEADKNKALDGMRPLYLPYELCGVDLRQARLRRFDFGLVNLAGANLAGAKLERANLEGEKRVGPRRQGVHLKHANLRGAKMKEAKLRGAELNNADLTGADLTGADLGGADLTNADLTNADLRGANLKGAKLEGAKLEGAKIVRNRSQRGNVDRIHPKAISIGSASVDRVDLDGAVANGTGTRPPTLEPEVVHDDGTQHAAPDTRGAVDPARFITPRTGVTKGGDDWLISPGSPDANIAASATVSVVA